MASSLHMSESLAGVTLLAFGNGSPDLIATFTAMKSHSGGLAIGELIGASAFITTLVLGSVALVSPFHLPAPTLLYRDAIFFLGALVFIAYITWDEQVSLFESLILIAYYGTYVLSVVISHWYHHHRIAASSGPITSNYVTLTTTTTNDLNDMDQDTRPLLLNTTTASPGEWNSSDLDDNDGDFVEQDDLSDVMTTHSFTIRRMRAKLSLLDAVEYMDNCQHQPQHLRRLSDFSSGAGRYYQVNDGTSTPDTVMTHSGILSSQPWGLETSTPPVSPYVIASRGNPSFLSPPNLLLPIRAARMFAPDSSLSPHSSTKKRHRHLRSNSLDRRPYSASTIVPRGGHFLNSPILPCRPTSAVLPTFSNLGMRSRSPLSGSPLLAPTSIGSENQEINHEPVAIHPVQGSSNVRPDDALFPIGTNQLIEINIPPAPSPMIENEMNIWTPEEDEEEGVTLVVPKTYRMAYALLFPMVFSVGLATKPPKQTCSSRWIHRVAMIIVTPLFFVLRITVPVISCDTPSTFGAEIRYPVLCSLQLLFGGLFATFVILGSLLDNIARVLLSIAAGVTLSVIGVVMEYYRPGSRNSRIWAWFGFLIGIIWIYVIANEVVTLLKTLGAALYISDGVLGLTVFAMGNSLGDFVANLTMAKLGFSTMAVSACFASPMLNLVLGVGVSSAYMTIQSPDRVMDLAVGTSIKVVNMGLIVIITLALMVLAYRQFHVGKVIGLALISSYSVLVLTALIIAF